jgi:hypothetical protein
MRFARRRALRMLLVATMVLVALAMWVLPAAATYDRMKVREVYASSGGAQFIELQMYSPGQNQVQDHVVRVFDENGDILEELTFSSNVPNGADQATILLATTQAATQFGVTPDLTMGSPVIPAAGGKVCYDILTLDCVSWGTYHGPHFATGTPHPGGIPEGQSIERKIAANCPTSLEDADDTGDSAYDFQVVASNPEPNSATPNEIPCAPAGGPSPGKQAIQVLNLKTKVKGGKVTVTGQLDRPDAGPVVKVSLLAKGSPFRKVGGAVDGLDAQTRFKVRIAVPDDVKRCKTLVKYRGDVIAQKTFGC